MTPQDLMKAYEKALASQQWSEVEPLMHDDVCVTFSNGTFKGKEAVKQSFETNFSLIKEEEYSISNLHWALINDTCAVCLYRFQWQGIIDDELCSGGGRGTSTLVYSSGHWQVLTEHLGPHAN